MFIILFWLFFGLVKINDEFGYNYHIFMKDHYSFIFYFYDSLGTREYSQIGEDDLISLLDYCRFNKDAFSCDGLSDYLEKTNFNRVLE